LRDVYAPECDGHNLTDTAKSQFTASLDDLAMELLRKTSAQGRLHPIEPQATAEDVLGAARRQRVAAPTEPKWVLPLELGCGLCLAGAGVGGSHLDTQWGVLVFGVSLAAFAVLFVLAYHGKKGG
jgi:hypothetical protein